MAEGVSTSRRFPRQFPLWSLFAVTAATAIILTGIAWQRRASQERRKAGYVAGFVFAVTNPDASVDFRDASHQNGFDAGSAHARRLCSNGQGLPSEMRERVQVVLELLESGRDVDADLRHRIARQLRRISHRYEDYDAADIYDQMISSGAGFRCGTCDVTRGIDGGDPEKETVVSFHQQGQAAKEAGWLVESTEGGIRMVCPKCRHGSAKPSKTLQSR